MGRGRLLLCIALLYTSLLAAVTFLLVWSVAGLPAAHLFPQPVQERIHLAHLHRFMGFAGYGNGHVNPPAAPSPSVP
jgi:hypothetical protein